DGSIYPKLRENTLTVSCCLRSHCFRKAQIVWLINDPHVSLIREVDQHPMEFGFDYDRHSRWCSAHKIVKASTVTRFSASRLWHDLLAMLRLGPSKTLPERRGQGICSEMTQGASESGDQGFCQYHPLCMQSNVQCRFRFPLLQRVR